MPIADDVLRRYRKERARGIPAQSALRAAKFGSSDPAYPFLADLDIFKDVSGTVDAFTVSVRVVADEDGRLWDDDVTGWFTDDYEDGCVKNMISGSNGHGLRYYHPSNYTMQYVYDEYRKDGMSKSVARAALAERIKADMYDDANREYYGVIVKVSVNGHELVVESLWGIDSIPSYDVQPYLVDVTGELIGTAIDAARKAIPGEVQKLEAAIAALRAVGGDSSRPGE